MPSSGALLKTLLALAVIAMLAVTLFDGAFFTSQTEDSIARLDVAAAEAVKFIDTSLDEKNGQYHLFFNCSRDEGKCVPVDDPKRPPHMGYSIMSLDHVGRATNDERLTTKAKTLMDQAIEKCETDSRYCEWSFFPLHFYAKTTDDPRYRDAMLKISDYLMKERPLRELLGNISVKWWLLYDVTGDRMYRDRLVKVADEQLEKYPADRMNDEVVYTFDGGDVRAYDIPIIWTLYLPAYKATGDAKYLKPAIDFFDTAEPENHLDKFWSLPKGGDLVKAIESLVDIAEADPTRHDAYREKARSIVDVILRERWDTPEHKLVNGDYGILVSPTEKATNTQGWLIHSLLELADVETMHHY